MSEYTCIECNKRKDNSEFDEGFIVCRECCKDIKGEHDPVEHPIHYCSHPSGVESITIASEYNFCLGNVIKYVWRAGLKNDELEDLKKARWYLDYEIKRRESESSIS